MTRKRVRIFSFHPSESARARQAGRFPAPMQVACSGERSSPNTGTPNDCYGRRVSCVPQVAERYSTNAATWASGVGAANFSFIFFTVASQNLRGICGCVEPWCPAFDAGGGYFAGAAPARGLGLVVISKSSVRKGVTGRPSLLKRLNTGLSAHA